MPNNSFAQVRTRFAPSPTGYVHIGSLRTALFSFLLARKFNGSNILRIEDTDQNRLVEGAVLNLLKVMQTVGIEFDEGFYLNDHGEIKERGDFGPYLQSARLKIYHEHIAVLLENGSAYYCFCSENRLDELRKEQIALKKPPMYDRLCRGLNKTEVQNKLSEFEAARLRPVIRQAIPETGFTVIKDLIYKEILVEHKILDDQVLIKSDGFPTYHLAVVVDDHLMKITHVIRGEEWIASTPKHILLYKAFGWEPTLFAHLPLILNPDKTKLSKRQGDVSVESYLEKGYLKEALLNFVAFLGWNPKTQKEIYSLSELISDFDLFKINKSGAVFDLEKLEWLNGLYIRQMPVGELVERAREYWEKAGWLNSSISTDYLEKIVALEKDRLKKLSEIIQKTEFYFMAPQYSKDGLLWKNRTYEETMVILENFLSWLENNTQILSVNKHEMESAIKNYIREQNLDNGSLLWPLRVALTGLSASPNPFEIIEVLVYRFGSEEIIKRLNFAINLLKTNINI